MVARGRSRGRALGLSAVAVAALAFLSGCDAYNVGKVFDGFGWPQGGKTPQAERPRNQRPRDQQASRGRRQPQAEADVLCREQARHGQRRHGQQDGRHPPHCERSKVPALPEESQRAASR